MTQENIGAPNGDIWAEYDAAAEWCARRGLKGEEGDPLPPLLSTVTYLAISGSPEAFQERVRATAYAIAMESRNLPR